ncbi:MAG: hypothetical protein PHH77_03210 [Victivallaceae bacterium]|nr:hypothetical protein [Victivallaceae bacterium]
MKKKPQLNRLEAVFKAGFNVPSTITVSPEWQTGLLERLRQMTPFPRPSGEMSVKFERNIWRALWVTFAASVTAAVIFAVRVYLQPEHFESELNNTIYSGITLSDQGNW